MAKQLFVCYSLGGVITSDVIPYNQKIDGLIGFMALKSIVSMKHGGLNPDNVAIINFFRLS